MTNRSAEQMQKAHENKAWDEQREKFEEFIGNALSGRADQQGWFAKSGKLNSKGQAAALEFVIGMASALEMIDHPAKQWLLNQCFLCAVRGTQDRFVIRPRKG